MLPFSLFGTNYELKTLSDFSFSGKRVFLRTDFNVPLWKEGTNILIADDTRVKEALPTIEALLEQSAKVIVASHLGRPGGKVVSELSLERVAAHLSKLMDKDVFFSGECDLTGIRHLVNGLKGGEILVLENVRFWKGEEANAPDLSEQYLKLTDIYINDAFGTLHRNHSSTVGLPGLSREKGIGLLVEKELRSFAKALSHPKRPLLLLFGGAKVSDKLPVLEKLLPFSDAICIGGAMSYTFLTAKGVHVGKSLVERNSLPFVKQLLSKAEALNIPIYLPEDHIVAQNEEAKGEIIATSEIPTKLAGFDIGPKTIEKWIQVIESSSTIIWNGPLGLFEREAFQRGTVRIAQAVSRSSVFSIIGGGDSLAALAKAGVQSKISHCSTGGGAMLKLLSGTKLPALEVLSH